MSGTNNDETKANYWHEQIQAWQASGQSQQTFCKVNGLSYPRFTCWRGKFRRVLSLFVRRGLLSLDVAE
ncbi:MAG: hypothetical protein ABW148_16855 [Sedimenticola sp.]